MERLTIDEIIRHCDRKVEMYEKACDVKYLETAVMGNGIKEYWEHKQVAEYLKKLKEYEDLEEQGLLLRLPCKVGDVLYFAHHDRVISSEVLSAKYHAEAENHGVFIRERLTIDVEGCSAEIDFCDIGKRVFLTREEAEAKLKELRG